MSMLLLKVVLTRLFPVPVSDMPRRALPSSADSPPCGPVYLTLTDIIIAAPFFRGRTDISLAMTCFGGDAATVCFADLVGASVGCALVLPGLTLLKGPDLIAVVGALGA